MNEFDTKIAVQTETTSQDSTTTGQNWSDKRELWGNVTDASSRIRERFQALDAEIDHIIKLNGEISEEYGDYRLKRVTDGQVFKPTQAPIVKGKFNSVTYVAVVENG